MGAVYTAELITNYTGLGDAIGGAIVFLFPAELGAVLRLWESNRRREVERDRLREREQLARELHDTVAHHVSAIVVQAQAGRTVAGSDPAAAAGVLGAIEEEAARTLHEMRVMIGTLRHHAGAELNPQTDLTPQKGVADIAQLGGDADPPDIGSPPVTVTLEGDTTGLRPSVQSALYRLAQESVTNARRHARRATRIDVSVVADAEQAVLTVRDDGETTSLRPQSAGFGLVGMEERATLHGGTFAAGPTPTGGWLVEAALPRDGLAGRA